MSSLYECAADCCRVQAMRGLCGGSIIQISLFLVKFEMECPPLKFLISPRTIFLALFFPRIHPPPSCDRSRASRVFKTLIFMPTRANTALTRSAVILSERSFVSLETNGEHSLESVLRQPATRRRFIGGGRSSRQGGGSVDDEDDGGGSNGVGEGRKIGSVTVEEER